MTPKNFRLLVASIIILMQLILTGCKNQTTQSVNRDPVISAFVASTNQIQLPDTFTVTCNAYDPDGDSLLFNWGCSGFLAMQGAPETEPYVLENSKHRTVTFYSPSALVEPADSITISCGAMDGKGGSASTHIVLPLRHQ